MEAPRLPAEAVGWRAPSVNRLVTLQPVSWDAPPPVEKDDLEEQVRALREEYERLQAENAALTEEMSRSPTKASAHPVQSPRSVSLQAVRERSTSPEVASSRGLGSDQVEPERSTSPETATQDSFGFFGQSPPHSPTKDSTPVAKSGTDTVSHLGGKFVDIDEEDLNEQLEDENVDEIIRQISNNTVTSRVSRRSHVNLHMDADVMRGSAISQSRPVQYSIYLLAFGGLVFVLLAKARGLGDHIELQVAQPSILLMDMIYAVAAAGLVAFLVNLLNQPLILGYLLGGVLVGSNIGLNIIKDPAEMSQLSNLGLIFLLFMIGLELDVSELFKMGPVVIGTGLLQFPLCAGVMIAIFMGCEAAFGINFGGGPMATIYTGATCGISSTMIVVKLLSEKAETDSGPGRLTVGILIFQDIWAIIVLAVQPKMPNVEILGLVKTFVMIAVLIIIALTYAKFVIPAGFVKASASVELMLIIALGWCFFMGALAVLPFIGLSLELASLIAGVALATFPYSAEFNGKIKFIRDFFITLFFVGLGMQIPVPTVSVLARALLVAFVVLVVRWLGIFLIVWALRGGTKLAAMATINLSQISEFALVICSLGMQFGHVDEETLTVLIWTFSILAINSSYMIGYNIQLYGFLARGVRSLTGRGKNKGDQAGEDADDDHHERDIVLLGFNKVAAQLLVDFELNHPHMLHRLHVVAARNLESIKKDLEKRHVTWSYGDIGSADVLEHACHGEPRLVISSIPDSLLRSGLTNLDILKAAKQVWPHTHVICSSDGPDQAVALYESGADYVLRQNKLAAEHLHELITEHTSQLVHHRHPDDDLVEKIFEQTRSESRKDSLTVQGGLSYISTH